MSDHALIWVMSVVILAQNWFLFWVTNRHIDDAIDYLVAERRAWEESNIDAAIKSAHDLAVKLDKEIPD